MDSALVVAQSFRTKCADGRVGQTRRSAHHSAPAESVMSQTMPSSCSNCAACERRTRGTSRRLWQWHRPTASAAAVRPTSRLKCRSASGATGGLAAARTDVLRLALALSTQTAVRGIPRTINLSILNNHVPRSPVSKTLETSLGLKTRCQSLGLNLKAKFLAWDQVQDLIQWQCCTQLS